MNVQEQIESMFGSRDMRMKVYRKHHMACPACGSNNTVQTLRGITYEPEIYDDNQADCGQCGWTGIVHDLEGENVG